MRCPFCDNVEAGLVVLSEDDVFAIVDRQPINPGHVMVAPRRHFESLTELPDEIALAVIRAVRRVSAAVKQVAGPDSVTHISDDDVTGSGVNQVPHFKFHIIPRYENDAVKIDWNRPPAPESSELRTIAEQIRAAMA